LSFLLCANSKTIIEITSVECGPQWGLLPNNLEGDQQQIRNKRSQALAHRYALNLDIDFCSESEEVCVKNEVYEFHNDLVLMRWNYIAILLKQIRNTINAFFENDIGIHVF
jgi:hypothetical protein